MSSVIPAPVHVAMGAGEFSLRPGTRVEYADLALAPIVERFCEDIANGTGTHLEPVRIARDHRFTDEGAIRIELVHESLLDAMPRPRGPSPTGDADERYALTIAEPRIAVHATAALGIARGLTTLTQLAGMAPNDPEGIATLHAVRILDAPRLAWRGVSFDLPLSADELRQLVDLLALYKLNVLERRTESSEGLVRYAAERFVTVIRRHSPETVPIRSVDELPGVARSTWSLPTAGVHWV